MFLTPPCQVVLITEVYRAPKVDAKARDRARNHKINRNRKPPARTSAPPSETTTDDLNWTPSATAKANCKAILQELENFQPAEKREFTNTLHSRRLLQKRKPKSGIACIGKTGAWKISSFEDPSNPGDPDAKRVKELGFDFKAYGWTKPKECDKYEWGGAFFKKGDLYDTEHILEWSVITNFFTELDSQYKQDEFVHPDPTKNGKKTKFCEYWKESWDFQDLQEIPNPAPNSGAKPNFVQLKPIEWIAANYPYKDKNSGDFMGEFKLL